MLPATTLLFHKEERWHDRDRGTEGQGQRDRDRDRETDIKATEYKNV